jgi:hypothetical protein
LPRRGADRLASLCSNTTQRCRPWRRKHRPRRSPAWWISSSIPTPAPAGCGAALPGATGQYGRRLPRPIPSAQQKPTLSLRPFTSNRYYGRAPSGELIQDRRREYLKVYEAWQAQLRAVHRVLLEAPGAAEAEGAAQP